MIEEQFVHVKHDPGNSVQFSQLRDSVICWEGTSSATELCKISFTRESITSYVISLIRTKKAGFKSDCMLPVLYGCLCPSPGPLFLLGVSSPKTVLWVFPLMFISVQKRGQSIGHVEKAVVHQSWSESH